MKKAYVAFLIAALGMSACGRNYTCPVYSKAGKPEPATEVHASVKKTQQGRY